MQDRQSGIVFLVGGLLLALALIMLSTRGGTPDDEALRQRFAPSTPDPSRPTSEPLDLPQVSLPSLPPDLRETVVDLGERLAGGGAVPALTPVASGPRVEVEVRDLRRSGERVQVRGSIRNISAGEVQVPPGAFSFRDSADISYATAGTGGATLAPGQETTFDLSVPLPEGRGLKMMLDIPPDPPIEQTLLVEVREPS